MSSFILVTLFNKEYRLKPILMLMTGSILGNADNSIVSVAIGRDRIFRQQTQHISARVKSRLNVMKALFSTSFGH